MAKLLSKYDWNKHTYWNVDVNGTKYEIKDAKDEADAIALAESIDAYRIKELTDAPVKELNEAIKIVLSSDLKIADSKSVTDLKAKMASAVAPESDAVAEIGL